MNNEDVIRYKCTESEVTGVGMTIVGRVRQVNEDNCTHAETPNGSLFVVCDGMGGHVGGAVASDIAVRSIAEFLSVKRDDVRVALADSLNFANQQILGRVSEDPSLRGMGTTACIVLINSEGAWIAHVGDSRIYVYEKTNKRLYRVTKDHSFVQSLVDDGLLDDRDAESHPKKNIITRALGLKNELNPEVCPTPLLLAQGDNFLICSDGLCGMIDDDLIEKILMQDSPLEDKVSELVTAANAPDKGFDNITAQLVEVLASNQNVSKHPDFNPQWRMSTPTAPNFQTHQTPNPDIAKEIAAESVGEDRGPIRPKETTSFVPQEDAKRSSEDPSWIKTAIICVTALIVLVIILICVLGSRSCSNNNGKDNIPKSEITQKKIN